jgi:antitoxin ParD1/3/4
MHINLSPEVESYILSKVGSGFYGNASEVVRDAIRRMRDDDERLAALRAAVQIGDEQIARGAAESYTPELMRELARAAVENARKGKGVHPDVVP